MQSDGDLAAGLVDPLADLGGLVDGDAGGDEDRRGDYKACLEGLVRPWWGTTARMALRRRGAMTRSCEQVGREIKKGTDTAGWKDNILEGVRVGRGRGDTA